MNIVVLSPHFDDAPLSLGQSMLSGALSHHSVKVGIVYGRSNWVRWFHPTRSRTRLASAIRRAEEVINAGLFGYRFTVGNREEAVLRIGSMNATDFMDPTFDPQASPEFGPTLDLVRTWAQGADLVLVPLGIGDHVDHRIVTAAGVALHADGINVGFYEDRPYACSLGDEEIEQRASVLGMSLTSQPVSSPISAEKHRRLFYPSQFDDYFRTAMQLDEEFERPERLWFPESQPVILPAL